MKQQVVIMAGGIGSRFWPWSRQAKPKQFLDIFGTGSSLLQSTVKRFSKLVQAEDIWIVTHQDYVELIKEQCPEILYDQILTEPQRKNTAPCIAYASAMIKRKHSNAAIIISPADHLILDESNYLECCKTGLEYAAQHNCLLMFGISASRPDTGYGYIHLSESVEAEYDIFKIKEFVEKPDHNTAVHYLKSGNYAWNSGIFISTCETMLHNLQNHCPEVYELFYEISSQSEADQAYHLTPSISIDYAVMEKTSDALVMKVDFGWSDLGTWTSVYELMEHDDQNNAIQSHYCIQTQTNNCLLKNTEDKMIAIHGVENLIIVNTKDALLICDKNEEQKIKQLLSEIEQKTGTKFI